MNRRLVTLSAVAVLLAAYVGFTEGLPLWTRGGGEAPKPTAENPAAPAPDATPVKLNPLQGLDPNSYAGILEHPLFNPGRQPRPPAVAEQPPAPAEQPVAEPPPPPAQGPRAEDYVLLGVGGTTSDPVAALRVNADSQVLYLRKGQSVGAWTVLEIGARDIVIGTPEDHVTVALFKDSADASGEAPAPAEAGGEELAPPAPPAPQ